MVAAPKTLCAAVLTLTIGFAMGGFNPLAAQSRKDDLGWVQGVAVPAYWIDPSTGLMWPARDNLKAVTWHTAMKYCRNLRLAGYSDWRQPTLDELASLIEKVSSATGRVGGAEIINIGPRVKRNLLLSGDAWSANREINRFGKPYGPGWFFNFTTSKPSYDLQLFHNTKYALCVRRAEK